MSAGRFEVRTEPVIVREVLDRVVTRWSDRTDAKRHKISRRVARGVPKVWLDRQSIDQALDELVDNAVKYSPEGGRIDLIASVGAADGVPVVRIAVTDRGVGIPADRIDDVAGRLHPGRRLEHPDLRRPRPRPRPGRPHRPGPRRRHSSSSRPRAGAPRSPWSCRSASPGWRAVTDRIGPAHARRHRRRAHRRGVPRRRARRSSPTTSPLPAAGARLRLVERRRVVVVAEGDDRGAARRRRAPSRRRGGGRRGHRRCSSSPAAATIEIRAGHGGDDDSPPRGRRACAPARRRRPRRRRRRAGRRGRGHARDPAGRRRRRPDPPRARRHHRHLPGRRRGRLGRPGARRAGLPPAGGGVGGPHRPGAGPARGRRLPTRGTSATSAAPSPSPARSTASRRALHRPGRPAGARWPTTRRCCPRLADEPDFGGDAPRRRAARRARPSSARPSPSSAPSGAFADRWDSVFDFRDAGAVWGLVALDQGVGDGPRARRGRGRALAARSS